MNYTITIVESLPVIKSIIASFNSEFTVPLKLRVGNLDDYSEKLKNNAKFITINNDEGVIGFVAYYINSPDKIQAYISQIAVINRFRSKGIGKKLIEYVIDDIRNTGFKQIKLEVDKENKPAIQLYNRYGFCYATFCN